MSESYVRRIANNYIECVIQHVAIKVTRLKILASEIILDNLQIQAGSDTCKTEEDIKRPKLNILLLKNTIEISKVTLISILLNRKNY